MKKSLLYTILLAFSALAVNAQVLYEQDFTDGFGAMTLFDGDQASPHPNAVAFGSNWNVVVPGQITNFNIPNQGAVAVSNSFFSPAGRADDWMITPAIELTASASLSWKAVSLDAAYADSYEVLISTTGPEVENFTKVISNVGAEISGNLNNRSADLSSYVGETVWIAFHNTSNDRFVLVIDDIMVRIPNRDDAIVRNFSLDRANFVPSVGGLTAIDGEHTLTGTIENYGFNDINQLEVIYSINGMETTETIDVNLTPGQSYTFTSAPFDAATGSSLFTFGVNSVNGTDDPDPSNNSSEDQIITFLPPVPDFVGLDTKGNQVNLHSLLAEGKSVILDFFASWCGPCEISTPNLNAFFESNGAGAEDFTVLGITVEQSDNDAVVNNLGWGATYPKFSYSDINELYWVHFNRNHPTLDEDDMGFIPYFAMICPNTGNPAYSEVNYGRVGGTTFGDFTSPLNVCRAELVGADDIDILTGITAFPNPNNTGSLSVEFGLEETAVMDVNMVNLQGQLIKSVGTQEFNAGNNEMTIDISELNAGMYFLQMTKDGQVSSLKVTVVK